MKQRSWVLKEQDDGCVSALCTGLGISTVTARLLVNRGLDSVDKAKHFLNKSIDSLSDPMRLPDMDRAVARVEQALARNERITIFGDYDVDGITSTSILYDYLTRRGGVVDYYIPNRNEEGYGLSIPAVDSIVQRGSRLMITVDSGITALEEVAHAAASGLDTVVTDHHECQEQLPAAVAVVNPKRADSDYPFKELAGVGVVFKLICAMEGREALQQCIDRYIELVAFGTVADVMPLTGENRVIVALGMKRIAATKNPGLRALITCSGIENRRITASTVGFTLAPRVNAVGRVGCASRAVELFLTQDPAKAAAIAQTLCDANRTRQEEEDKILRRALADIERDEDFGSHNIIVLAEQDWHHGIIGIVASRLSDLYYLPSIMISFDEEGVGKGSCRSISSFNLYEALEHCSEHLDKFGGHALAAGLTVRREHYDAFKQAITAYADQKLTPEDLSPRLNIDCEIAPGDISLETVTDISYLEPYGMSNPAPLFLCRGLTVADIYPLSGDKHLRLTLRQGSSSFTAFLFGRSRAQFPFVPGERIDICCNLDLNTFRGVQSAQVVIKDYRESEQQVERRRRGAELYSRFCEGRLTAQEAPQLQPAKSDFVAVYRLFSDQCSMTLVEACRRLTTQEQGPMELCRLRVCLDVLEEMGIFQNDLEGDQLTVAVNQIDGKVNLNHSEILQRLRKLVSSA